MQLVRAILWRHLQPLLLHHIFRHYLINGTIFGKKVLNIKCVLIFSTTFIWNISHSKQNLARYCHKCRNVMWNTRYSRRILIKIVFPQQSFKKSSNIVSSKSIQWEQSCSMRAGGGLTDGHDANSYYSQFYSNKTDYRTNTHTIYIATKVHKNRKVFTSPGMIGQSPTDSWRNEGGTKRCNNKTPFN